MAVYVERDAFVAWIEKQKRLSKVHTIMMLQETPAADVAPVVHARWEMTDDDFYMGLTIFKCSACREEFVFEDLFDVDALNYNYCPNCGAKMERED